MAKKQLLFHALTNHKLHSVRLLLELAQGQVGDAFVHVALLESALVTLLQAYRSFLGEIACVAKLEQWVLPDLDSITAKDLKLLLFEHHKVVPELEEVYLLESNNDSWLFSLFSYYQQSYLNKLELKVAVTLDDTDIALSLAKPGMIAIRDLSSDILPALTSEDLTFWRSALQSLVLKVRECLQEW